MQNNKDFENLIREFSALEEVDSILLAGSRTTDSYDENSDYDVYVYSDIPIPVEKRKKITDKYCSYMETNSQYWETEDDGVLKENDVEIELIYRDYNFIKNNLDSVVINCNAHIGYTTCFWANFLSSKILFDKTGRVKKLMDKYNLEYPENLRRNIIKKNHDLLRTKIPAYYFQIEKALKRNDRVSVLHRTTAFLESYFDIVFALNKIKHPGEKKIMDLLKRDAKILPEDMETDVSRLIESVPMCDKSTLSIINELCDKLEVVISEFL